MMLTGEANFVGSIIADKVAGLTALYATMMALFHRERTGEGQEVEVSMFETMASFMLVEHANGTTVYVLRSAPRTIPAQSRPSASPYRTNDGYIAALIYNDKHWGLFVEAVKPGLGERRARDAASSAHVRSTGSTACSPRPSLERTTEEWLDAVSQARHSRGAAAHARRAVRQSSPERGRLLRGGRLAATARALPRRSDVVLAHAGQGGWPCPGSRCAHARSVGELNELDESDS